MLDFDLAETHFEADGINIFGNSTVQSPVNLNAGADETWGGEEGNQAGDLPRPPNPYLRERLSYLMDYQVCERQEWHSDLPLQISCDEHPIFKIFVSHISTWVRDHCGFLP